MYKIYCQEPKINLESKKIINNALKALSELIIIVCSGYYRLLLVLFVLLLPTD